MPERNGFSPGEPAWTDLVTDDVAAAATFYSTIFGWLAETIDDPDAGGYTMLTLNGRQVAAVSPKMTGDPGPNRWNVYVATEDAEKTAEVAAGAGATVLAPAFDVLTAGRMAVLADPAGAVISLWQAGEHHGAAVTDEPGTLTWVELTTSDVAAAQEFYGTVFGWGVKPSDDDSYAEFTLGGKSVAGVMPKPAEMPAGVPPYWMPYFQVVDPDRTAAEAAALGGTVVAPPDDIPGDGGRYAVLADPQGAMFGLYRPA